MARLLLMFSIKLAFMMGLISVPSLGQSASKTRATLILSFNEDRPQLVWTLGRSHWVLYQPKESLHQELARTFTEFFTNSNMQTRVYLQGQEEDLFREGRDPDNKILIWISHSGKGEGLAESSMIVDAYGHNVLPLIQRNQWKVQNLIVLGCDNDFLMGEWNRQHPNTRLWVSGAHLLVRPVKQMLNLLERITDEPSMGPQDEVNGSQTNQLQSPVKIKADGDKVLIRAERYREPSSSVDEMRDFLPSLRLENFDGQVLTVFPSMLPSENRQEVFFYIEVSKVNFGCCHEDSVTIELIPHLRQLFNFQLIDSRIVDDAPKNSKVGLPALDGSKHLNESIGIGSHFVFSVVSPFPFRVTWNALLGKNGAPLGHNRRIFRAEIDPKDRTEEKD